MSIQSTLTTFGYAQVLVTLKRVSPGDVAAMTAAASQILRLGHYFKAPADSHSGAIAKLVHCPPAPVRFFRQLGLILGTVDQQGYAEIRKHPLVKTVHEVPPLSLIRPLQSQAQPLKPGLTWGLERLGIERLWREGLSGKGVIVGHLDTGLDGAHPALRKAIHAFAEFDLAGNLLDRSEPYDSDVHGTHTAGTIAAREYRKSRFGVAPGAMLASAMVIEGGDVLARIVGGMDWVVGQGAKVLSMSLGFRGYDASFAPLIEALRRRGVLPVIAVGNEGPGTSRSPGNYANVLSVGASDDQDRVAAFSSSQRFTRVKEPLVPDIVAPGVDIGSCLPNRGYGLMSGTSMATPHVAGLAALLWEAKPEAEVQEIEQAILDSCSRPKSMTETRGNRGLPDALRAVEILTKTRWKSSSTRGSKPARKGKRRSTITP
jgi:subtilisin